jgi:sugar lactone lactonase YvrE
LANGQQVTLLNNAGDALTLQSSNNTFAFTTPVAYGGSYSVTVGTQPTGQTCTASAASGSGVVANVSTVQITCSANTYTIGGTLSGLGSGQQVTLLNNGGNAKTLTANGSFTFTTPVAYNGAYSVTVSTQPTGQTCTLTNATGSGVAANVSNVGVSCAASTQFPLLAGRETCPATDPIAIDGTGASASVPFLGSGEAYDAAGNLYLVTTKLTLVKITPAGVVTTIAGTYFIGGSPSAQDGTGSGASFGSVTGMAVDASGNIYVSDTNAIRKVTPAGVVTSIAGSITGPFTSGYADGPGTTARFTGPHGLAIDATGNIYVADTYNNVIRKITSAGDVSTYAGVAFGGGYVNGNLATAQFNFPQSMVFDASGNLFVVDLLNNVIREITPGGTVSTFAGGGGAHTSGYADGIGTAALFEQPSHVTIDNSGNLFVDDWIRTAVRKITPAGVVTTPYVTPLFHSQYGLTAPVTSVVLPIITTSTGFAANGAGQIAFPVGCAIETVGP